MTLRAGIIQWCLNKLEDYTGKNKKKLNKDDWEVVQSSTRMCSRSGQKSLDGTNMHAFVQQNLPNPNHGPSVLGSRARSWELDKVCPHGADITVQVEQTNNYIIEVLNKIIKQGREKRESGKASVRK